MYAEMALRENMAKTPEAVMKFLKQEHSRTLPLAQKEYQDLLAEKCKVEGRSEKISRLTYFPYSLSFFFLN